MNNNIAKDVEEFLRESLGNSYVPGSGSTSYWVYSPKQIENDSKWVVLVSKSESYWAPGSNNRSDDFSQVYIVDLESKAFNLVWERNYYHSSRWGGSFDDPSSKCSVVQTCIKSMKGNIVMTITMADGSSMNIEN